MCRDYFVPRCTFAMAEYRRAFFLVRIVLNRSFLLALKFVASANSRDSLTLRKLGFSPNFSLTTHTGCATYFPSTRGDPRARCPRKR